jgi:hypothetical protein
MNLPSLPSSPGRSAKVPAPIVGCGADRPDADPPASRRWTRLRVVLLVTGTVAAAIFLGVYAFLSAWYLLTTSV